MTKADLHQIVDHLPEQAVDGAPILLGEISNGRIDPEQAWFWTREWQQRECEADEDLSTGRVTRYESDEQFLAALDERTKVPSANGPRESRSWLPLTSKEIGRPAEVVACHLPSTGATPSARAPSAAQVKTSTQLRAAIRRPEPLENFSYDFKKFRPTLLLSFRYGFA